MRFCLSQVQGRGAGLGNELIPWARSFLASQWLGVPCLRPAFGLNSRRYWRHFDTPRYDFLVNRAITKILPVFHFAEADYIQHGGGEFLKSFASYAEQHRLTARKSFVVTTSGMWGGFRHIAAARDFIYSTLYQSRFAARNLLAIRAKLNPAKITVAMHVRFGDFQAAPSDLSAYRGQFNLTLPIQWYRNIALNIRSQLGSNVQFLIVSDGTHEQLAPLVHDIDAILTSDLPDSDCSDLLALANADLLVCSISSFSAMAAFLSKAPYLWFEPHLQKHVSGHYSIWGHEPSQELDESPTQQAIRSVRSSSQTTLGRGVPVSFGGNLPPSMIADLQALHQLTNQNSDLVMYGVVAGVL